MRRRPSSRLLVLDAEGRVLLFRFHYRSGALAGRVFWGTPGGELEPGESYAQGAVRELFEETGIRIDEVDPPVATRQFPMQLTNGEQVLADERLYLVRVDAPTLTRSGWTAEEHEVMQAHRWWSAAELETATETVYPENLAALLRAHGG